LKIYKLPLNLKYLKLKFFPSIYMYENGIDMKQIQK